MFTTTYLKTYHIITKKKEKLAPLQKYLEVLGENS